MAISVGINAGPAASSSSVVATGTIQHVISDAERTAFNIQDAALKSAIATYFGEAPDDAYVCSPTPWGDLYQTYGWPQVQTLFSVVSATVLGVTSEPAVVASQIFENFSSVPADFNCGITQEVSVTTESNWSETSTVEVGQTISYDISFLGSGAGGETSLSYSQSWEKGGSESQSVTLGTSSGITVTLQPNQSVEAELTASRGKLTVQIVYQLTLSGYTAINYGDTYKDHHFWALDINAVMAAAGSPTSITTTETIEIDFYANSKIVLKDPSGKSLTSFVVGPLHP
ncbi:follicular epithelium yolk protein subunit [Xanthomonas sp. 3058]|uniref:follicular epithelium yolk protein subunit n=1 Tax=Xanthomonas sp. 3058 TaxID=3035314 RepID=UPI00160C674C|nr:follicular epithelium yolk protein subunit [Xanthomonas sp. 3058]MBB5863671.1 hypothetical protein [Xanthomonas sp. 3058]